MDGRNAKLIKIHNRALVLKIIQQQGSISRKKIAKMTGLTQATITKITQYLLGRGLIVEQESEQSGSSSGRKPINLTINKERYKILSIYIGRVCLEGAVADLAGNLLYKHTCDERIIQRHRENLLQGIVGYIQDLLNNSGVDLQNVLGIGIAAPGPINTQKGIMRGVQGKQNLRMHYQHTAPFDWREIPLKETIQQEFGVNVFADNNANVSALAESWFGHGVGVSNFVLYSIGMGIGAGVVIDGMLYRGEDDVVSEIGHITVDLHGPRCICGNFGCLELYAGFADLVQKYQEASDDPSISDVEALFQSAYAGNTTALRMIQQKSKYLGIGAVSLANIFSPEYIIVAPNDIGNVDFSIIVDELQESVKKRAFSVIADKVNVLQSKLGDDVHLYGSVALVLQDFFQMLTAKG